MSNAKDRKGGLTGALAWKMMERFGVQIAQFVLQIILARILDPDHYGTLSMMIVFTNLANVFIQTGFNTSLVQNKDVTEEDYSSVFCVTLFVSLVLYGIIFVSAPFVSRYFEMPDIVAPLRVLALILIPGALNSVQVAKISRELDFKKVFTGNLIAILLSSVAGIVLAKLGAGLWALVAQTVINYTTAAIVMLFTVQWRPRLICNWKRVGVLFSFGWKLLVSCLLETFYQEIRSLVIGKKYDNTTLGFYNRGKQFPQFIITSVAGALQSVMLPALSSKQDDARGLHILTRNSIMVSAFIVFPMMAGIAGIAEPLVRVVLTDKWLPCVPYLQVYCFTLAFSPVHSCNLQAINAVGRSDIFLKLEIVKKAIGIGLLIGAVVFFRTPMAIALTGAISTVTSCIINAYPNKKLINYSYIDQMKDVLPSFLAAALMLVVVLLVGMIKIPDVLLLVIQIVSGAGVYILISAVMKLEPYLLLLEMLKKNLKK